MLLTYTNSRFQSIGTTPDFWTKIAQNYNDKTFANLENCRYWDQISPKNMNDKNFEKIKIKIVISI